MFIKSLRCENCGEPLYLSNEKIGIVKCNYCSTEYILTDDESMELVKLYLNNGKIALDNCIFEDALVYFDKALKIEPNDSEIYFYKALAKFKVQYLKDTVNNKLQPITRKFTNEKITDDLDFKKACEIALPNKKEIYTKKANEIIDIQKVFNNLYKSNVNYDCFICVKAMYTKTMEKTNDFKMAEAIYDFLKLKGYKPFLSEKEIQRRSNIDYESIILYALMKSKCMLVICSNEEYLNTQFLKNEYMKFLKIVQDEIKPSDAIAIAYNGHRIEKLPGKKGSIKEINLADADVMNTIENYVYSHILNDKTVREGRNLKVTIPQEKQSNSKRSLSIVADGISIFKKYF